MKKVLLAVLTGCMILSLMACGTKKETVAESGTTPENTQNTEISESKENTTLDVVPDTDGAVTTDHNSSVEATKKEEQSSKGTTDIKDEAVDSSLTTINVRMADEVGGDVHLSWKSMSSDSGSGIEVCRAVLESDRYEVIATITEDYYGFLSDGYIDQGAAGKGYYYGVRLTSGDSHGVLGDVLQSTPTEQSWFKNSSSYIRLVQQPEDPDYLIQFVEYDLSGNTTWNCDWPCMKNEDVFTWMVDDVEHTRTFQYQFITPMEYSEMGSEDFIFYANIGNDEFVMTMYSYYDELNIPIFDDTVYSKIN